MAQIERMGEGCKAYLRYLRSRKELISQIENLICGSFLSLDPVDLVDLVDLVRRKVVLDRMNHRPIGAGRAGTIRLRLITRSFLCQFCALSWL
jgi:hypothetical protein